MSDSSKENKSIQKGKIISLIEKKGITLPTEGETILIKKKKSRPGPAEKVKVDKDSGGFGDLSYLKRQKKEEEMECKVTGVYSRFISVTYTDNSHNIIPTTIPMHEILTKKCQIKIVK